MAKNGIPFTLSEVPETLYIKFSADVASSYRLDDVKLYAGNGGQSVTLPEDGGDNGGTTPEPGVGPYASDSVFVCDADDSVNASYGLGDTKINGNAVTGFKLGKSKQAGKFTSGAVGVEGTKYLNFYAQGWKGGDVTLYFRVDGGEVKSQVLNAHVGATGNPPYTALTAEEKDMREELSKRILELRDERNLRLKEIGKENALVRQIIDLALLSNGMLKDLGDRFVLAPEAYYISNYVLSDFV